MSATDPIRAADRATPPAELLAAFPWGETELGAYASWPAAVRVVVGLMLRSQVAQYVLVGPSLRMIYNGAYVDTLGAPASAFGQPLFDVWGHLRDELEPIVAEALAGGSSYFEDRPFLVHRNDTTETAWFTFGYTPMHDDHGAVAGVHCVLVETTQRIISARLRNERVARLQRLFEQAPGFVAVTTGPTHVYELANDSYLDFVGRRNIVGSSVRDALPELDERFIELLDDVYRSAIPFVGRGIAVGLIREGSGRIEDRLVDFVFQPIVEDDGAVSGIFIQGSDVTDQVATEAALRASEAKFRTIADAMPQMVWSTLPDGFHDYYNQQWYEFTGMPVGSTDGDAWNALFHPDDQERAWSSWRRSLATGEVYEIEYRLRHRSGEYRWVLGRALPVRDEQGQVVRWMGTCTDIHAQRSAQDALARSSAALREADRRKDEFLAMLAHELRNPLAPISTAAQVLRMAQQKPELVKESSEIISRQVRHMTKLVDDLLDVSRVTRGLVQLRLEVFDLRSAIRGAIEQVSPLVEMRSHALHTHLGGDALWVHGDRTRLTQIVANLLNNAAKYTPNGGEIALRGEVEGDVIVVSVSDNGQGITAALLPHVFELFTQADRAVDRSQGGLGIGLALVRSLVAMHGGEVTAQSEGLGRGSRFEVRLPAAAPPDRAVAHRDARPEAGTSSLHVVIVDDNRDAAQTLAILLDAYGHTTTTYADGGTALAQVDEHRADAYILDIGLPDMSGYELVRALRAHPGAEGARFFALTGYGQSADRLAAEEAGFDAHFVKPADAELLRQRLDDVARRKQAGAAAGGM